MLYNFNKFVLYKQHFIFLIEYFYFLKAYILHNFYKSTHTLRSSPYHSILLTVPIYFMGQFGYFMDSVFHTRVIVLHLLTEKSQSLLKRHAKRLPHQGLKTQYIADIVYKYLLIMSLPPYAPALFTAATCLCFNL